MTTKQQEPTGDDDFDAFEYVFSIKEKLEDIEESLNETKDTCSLLLKVFTDEDIKIKILEERNKNLESILRYTDAIKDNERRFNNMILELKGMVSLVRSENERNRNESMAKHLIEPMQDMQNAYNKISLKIFGSMFDLVKELHAKAFIVDEIQKHNPSEA